MGNEMDIKDEMIGEIQGLKALVSALAGMVVLMEGKDANTLQVLHDVAMTKLKSDKVSGPGIDSAAVSARAEALVDNVFASLKISFAE
jgi:hypothetical protein